MPSSLVDLIVRRATGALGALSPSERADTYVVSFWVNDEDDEPGRPVLRIGTNTESQVRESTPGPAGNPRRPIASDPAEARWNFAFWLQNELSVIGGSEDSEGRAAIAALFTEHGLVYEEDDISDEADAVGRQISVFVDACVEAARRLHDGTIPETFDRDLPVIVHELEYYDEIAEQNLSCNEPGLVSGFTQWIASMSAEE